MVGSHGVRRVATCISAAGSRFLPRRTIAFDLLHGNSGAACSVRDLSGHYFPANRYFRGLTIRVLQHPGRAVDSGPLANAFSGLGRNWRWRVLWRIQWRSDSRIGPPSIVVTLATMVTWREGLRWWRQGEFVHDLPETFQWFGLGQAGGQTAVLFITALVFTIMVLGTKYLSAGRFVYAVGSDAEAARLAGIRPHVVTFGVFVIMGALTGLAALLNAVRFNDVDPRTGTGLELQSIAAAVVGGVAISGGRGSLWGVLAGVLLLACIAPALVFLRLPPQWEKALQGGIILLAVTADGWRTVRASRSSLS